MAKVVRVVRTFSYRAGVRVRDSVLACDTAAGSDLTFISHAAAAAHVGAQRTPRARAGRRKILTTETTLALLGPAGDRLRPHALAAAYGRPFALGSMRIELFPSGFLPGSASLLCDRDGERLVYTGPIGAMAEVGGDPAAAQPATRVAGALCIDGTFGAPNFVFPPAGEALAAVGAFVRRSLGAQRAPVVLGDAAAPLLAAATELQRAGIALRAHRRIMAAAAAFRHAGLAAPALLRFAGTLRPGEALLWPADARDAPILRTLGASRPPELAFASGWAADPAAVARVRADVAIPLAGRADFAGLLRYVEASAAREVAVQHAARRVGQRVGHEEDDDGELCRALRERGIDAYPLGPPFQIALF